jgi:LacI family transcriptional regulator
LSVTLKDIARETGLSLATVSKYINGGVLKEANRAAVERAIRETGYTVNEYARSLKSNRSRSVGVIIPELNNVFITQIISQVEKILQGHGYSIIICDCHTDEKRECEAVRFLLGKMVDGIINMPVCQDGRHLKPALSRKVPVLLIDREIPGLRDADSVHIDNAAAADAAVSYLLEKGHRSIGIIVGPQEIYTSRHRLEGYRRALTSHGLGESGGGLVQYSDYTVQGGYESMRRLIQAQNGMTAVFVTNYEMTLGAVIAANESGIRLPDDLSLIGFDNTDLSRVTRPPLTIVTQPLEEIGTQAARILLERFARGGKAGVPVSVTLPAELREGGSVAELKRR